jgi:hypothetical protein
MKFENNEIGIVVIIVRVCRGFWGISLYRGNNMATYRDPVQIFAPLEVIERLLEIRGELGYTEAVYMHSSGELADFLDAYGFDVYAFSSGDKKINYGDYRAQFVPGGDHLHLSGTAH